MKNKKYIITILIVVGVIMIIVGSTFAYWNWSSNNAQKTNVTFTTGANFSCGADGGGNITNTNYFVPTTCNNTTYAIQRTIATTMTNNTSDPVYMDLWLTINSIGSGLSGSQNFRYKLTTSPDCNVSNDYNVIRQGTFYGKHANDTIELFNGVDFAGTYYLYVWLDSAETSSSTQNQSVNLSIGGTCTNQEPAPFSGTIYRFDNTYNAGIGENVSSYMRPTKAWCMYDTITGNNSCDTWWGYDTETECTSYLSTYGTYYPNSICIEGVLPPIFRYETNAADLDKIIFTKNVIVNDVITEEYTGFTVTPDMASGNTGVTAGTYYLRALDTKENNTCKSEYLVNGVCTSPYYSSNVSVLQNAFGNDGTYCTERTGYNVSYSCQLGQLNPLATLSGRANAFYQGYSSNNMYYVCYGEDDGRSFCTNE